MGSQSRNTNEIATLGNGTERNTRNIFSETLWSLRYLVLNRDIIIVQN